MHINLFIREVAHRKLLLSTSMTKSTANLTANEVFKKMSERCQKLIKNFFKWQQ